MTIFLRLFFLLILSLSQAATAQPIDEHGIAMYGAPALPQDFVARPYANPDAPKGGELRFAEVGSYDSLNPFTLKGQAPWALRFMVFDTLLARNWDEPFALYGLLAESVRMDNSREWVEFTLRDSARFSDGSPVTVDDVLWSFQALGTRGHPRYRAFWDQIAKIAKTGPRDLRIDFHPGGNRELPLLAGLRPVLSKSQWQDHDLDESGMGFVPIGSGPYIIATAEAGRSLTLRRNPQYWAKDLPIMRGLHNFDQIKYEYFADKNAAFEAFKSGIVNVYRESAAEKWRVAYDFPAVQRGDVVKSEIPHSRPSGMRGFALNTRRAPLNDPSVRQALVLAFNHPYISEAVFGTDVRRITSFFGNSDLARRPGDAGADVKKLLASYNVPARVFQAQDLPKGASRSSNRRDLRKAAKLLESAGWQIKGGVLMKDGAPLQLTLMLRQGDQENGAVADLYAKSLSRIGITLITQTVDNAQFNARQADLDFDLIPYTLALSLSPGTEQRLYFGSALADAPGTRNLAGIRNAAVDAMIEAILTAQTNDQLLNATRALDRLLMAGDYVIPFVFDPVSRIAHDHRVQFPTTLPLYGDWIGFLPDTWWMAAE